MSAGSEFARITHRIDQGEPETRDWLLSPDDKGSLYPGEFSEIVQELMDAKRFVARLEREWALNVTAIFDVTGLKKAIEPQLQICGLED